MIQLKILYKASYGNTLMQTGENWLPPLITTNVSSPTEHIEMRPLCPQKKLKSKDRGTVLLRAQGLNSHTHKIQINRNVMFLFFKHISMLTLIPRKKSESTYQNANCGFHLGM